MFGKREERRNNKRLVLETMFYTVFSTIIAVYNHRISFTFFHSYTVPFHCLFSVCVSQSTYSSLSFLIVPSTISHKDISIFGAPYSPLFRCTNTTPVYLTNLYHFPVAQISNSFICYLTPIVHVSSPYKAFRKCFLMSVFMLAVSCNLNRQKLCNSRSH